MAIVNIMCFGNAQKEDPDAKKNREIERQLREDQKRMQKEVKLLLLGKAIVRCEDDDCADHLTRRGRVGQVDGAEADATHSHQGLPVAGAETMEGHDLSESASRFPSGVWCYGGAGGGFC
jgi:hypothetical protein